MFLLLYIYFTLTHFFIFRSNSTKHKEAKMTDRKAVIKNADMSEDMQQDAVDCATQAIEKYNIEKVKIYFFYELLANLTAHFTRI